MKVISRNGILMTAFYCTSCRAQVLESIKVCPSCGNKSFAQSSKDNRVSQAPYANSKQTPTCEEGASGAAKKSWSWGWIWQVIAISLIMKFFGPAGGVIAVFLYFWQEPKLGKWPAIGLAAMAGILVPLLILSLMK